MAGDSYKLGVKPSAWYLSLFSDEGIRIVGADDGVARTGSATSLQNRPVEPSGWIGIGDDDLGFELHMPLTGSSVAPRHIESARSVLGQIVEMDDQARAVPSDHQDDEELAMVRIGDEVVWLDYWSTTVNSEWSTEFTRDPAGVWIYRGVRRGDELISSDG